MLVVTADFGSLSISWQKISDADVESLKGVSPSIDGSLKDFRVHLVILNQPDMISLKFKDSLSQYIPGTGKVRHHFYHSDDSSVSTAISPHQMLIIEFVFIHNAAAKKCKKCLFSLNSTYFRVNIIY